MKRLNSLPDRLRYLQPFRRKFAAHPEDLEEGSGEGPLFALFSKHIKGLSEADAQQLLIEDLAALEAWLALPENEGDCLQFARGFLLVSPAEMATRILEESAKAAVLPPWVEMDLPEGAKVKRIGNRDEAAMILRWKGLIVSLQAMPEELARKILKSMGLEDSKSTAATSSVCFGAVQGTKYVSITDHLISVLGTNQKRVEYLLLAPGGCILVTAMPISKKINHETWDESVLESFFHTLRVVKNPGTKV